MQVKFLVSHEGWKENVTATPPKNAEHGYIISTDPDILTRIRIIDEKGEIALEKGRNSRGDKQKVECEIPTAKARIMLDTFCKGQELKKTRYEVEVNGRLWEVDVFHGRLNGLVTATTSLTNETDIANIERPSWIGKNITSDDRFLLTSLALAEQIPAVGQRI